MRFLTFAGLLLGFAVAGCATDAYLSPNDPQYARSGAPRAGEPGIQPNNPYGRIQGNDGQGGSR